MPNCGVELTGSQINLVLLRGDKETFEHINVEPRKMILRDDEDAEEVRAVRTALFAFFRENNVRTIFVKKRNKQGKFAGGAVTFKLEGIIQLYEECPVSLIAPPTISAAVKKSSTDTPDSLKKYQYAAFQTAFASLA